jgi:hypothetical protein
MQGKTKAWFVTPILAILALVACTADTSFTGDNSLPYSCAAAFCFITQFFTSYDQLGVDQ